MKSAFETDGRLWLRKAADEHDLAALTGLMARPDRPGARIPLDDRTIAALHGCAFAKTIADIWPGMRPVRLVGFQKTEGQNWALPWHQDRVICVKNRADVSGHSNWSQKAGEWHCEPPEEVLQNMLFVRVHIDDSTQSNGAMEIARGSHKGGLIPADQAEATAKRFPCEITAAAPGDVLILPMLTLHRSGASSSTAERRVLRIDFASHNLQHPLEWSG